ncbi:DUF3048 domain-containing protein [Neobacillus dielmonensis]|uniref:DUF3048 domain-containing protein n=1 Tax=Neobacillus dielmonensis TaxID=1347369 RepID=UPI0005A89762|nr:DUF3048 domain-containing protein [Neobacillus dielmonensis]
MKKWAIALAAVLLLFTGCSKKDSVKTPVQEEKAEETVKQQEPVEGKQEDLNVFPLTGIRTEASTDGRAVAVMVNNHPKARPQSGLSKADIVYEMIAEGDVTRFLAVFQSEKPANIGPVRSARPYYIELAKGFNAFYVAHGYSEDARVMLESNYVDNINGMVYDGTLFKRSSTRKAPHNSYITYENVVKGAEMKKYSMDQTPPSSFKFLTDEEKQSLTGNPGSSVMITYSNGGTSNCMYEFDAQSSKYKRFNGSEQTVELDTNEPILLDNVFIIEADHQVLDSSGHLSIDLKSGGTGYLLQMGKVNEVNWVNKNGQIVPVKDGKEVGLVPGKTWVNVVPSKPGLAQSVSFDAN